MNETSTREQQRSLDDGVTVTRARDEIAGRALDNAGSILHPQIGLHATSTNTETSHVDHALRRNRTLSASPVRHRQTNNGDTLEAEKTEEPSADTRNSRRKTVSSRFDLNPRRNTVMKRSLGRATVSSKRPQPESMRSSSTLRNRTTTGRRGATLLERRPSLALHMIPEGGPMDDSATAHFSLAGPQVNTADNNQPYVEPGYHELNPAYEQPANVRPIWSLARPLPRVIRPGMRPTKSELHDEIRAEIEQDQRRQSAGLGPDVERGGRRATLTARPPARDSVQRPEEQKAEERRGSRTSMMSHVAKQSSGTEPFPAMSDEEDEPFGEDDVGESRLGAVPELTDRLRARNTSSHVPVGSFESDDSDPKGDAPATDEDLVNAKEWLQEYGEAEPLRPFGQAEEVHNFHTSWSVVRVKYRDEFAEFLGTFVVNLLGICSDLVVTASSRANLPAGNEYTTDWAWGLSVMLGIYVSGGVSGAHLNPAISIMLWIHRGFPLRRVGTYFIAQLLGAFVAALVAYALYKNDIMQFDGSDGLRYGGTMNSFITSPRFPWVTSVNAFFNEFVATSVLAGAVLALGDDSNAPPGAGMNAFIVGLVVTVLSMAFGYNTGAAMNPVRDFGPRLALLCVGYGGELFRNGWWVYGPWAGAIGGALFGSFVYDVLIFVGGESPVNYPTRRFKRAARKFRRRWQRRLRMARRDVRDGVEDGKEVM